MTGIIILAAGSSTRMGQAKQNLLYKGHTLLQTAISTALSFKPAFIAVVLGANADTILPTIDRENVSVLINKDWEKGMGSTISYSLGEVLKIKPGLSSVIFMLTDQPLVDTAILADLVAHSAPGKIISSSYNGTSGPPVLFDRIFFKDLLTMQGNEGAKKLLLKYPKAVIEVNFPGGAFDIDTPEDYNKLNS